MDRFKYLVNLSYLNFDELEELRKLWKTTSIDYLGVSAVDKNMLIFNACSGKEFYPIYVKINGGE